MSAQHTPGPWFVVPYGDGDSLVVCSDKGGEWRICFMATHGGTESVWQAIQANAALIASAPDMKDMLEKAAVWFEKYSVDHSAKAINAASYGEQHSREEKAKRNQERAEEIRMVLAKATGGHP